MWWISSWLSELIIKKVILMAVCSFHVAYAFRSDSTLYSCLIVKKLLARSSHEIWSASLVKWFSVRLRTKWFWVRVQFQSLSYANNYLKLFFVKHIFLIFSLFRTVYSCLSSIQWGVISTFLDKKLYMNFLVWFWFKCTKIYICKCLKQFSTCYNLK